MNFELAEMNMASAVLIPIVVAIVQAIKMTGWRFADRFAPLISIVVGILIAFFANHESPDWSETLLNGVLLGLSSSGLYSGLKKTSDEVRAERTRENRVHPNNHTQGKKNR